MLDLVVKPGLSVISIYSFFVDHGRGSELAPGKDSLRNEAIPKSAARVLNAQAVRDAWNMKKRKHEDGSGDGPGGKRRKTTERIARSGNKEKSRNLKAMSLTIQPGESIQHFNRSVIAIYHSSTFL